MNEDIKGIVSSSPKILELVYQDLAQPGVKVLGQALGTVLEFSTSFLLPVKLLNEKFRLNFTRRLNEYKEKLEAIPEDKRCEVHPQIGLPIIEKLSYTTSDEIADLFTNLLASASSRDMVNTAHPAFISMIERMSSDEARILVYLKDKEDIPYCDINAYLNQDRGFITLSEHVTMIDEDVTLSYPQNIDAYLANFVSLGILLDMRGVLKIDKTQYKRIMKKYQVEELNKRYVPTTFRSVEVQESYYQVTPFGKLFIKACIR